VSFFAIALIIAAAFVYAAWNYLAKRVGGSTVFVWLFAAVSALLYAPLALFVLFSQNVVLDETRIFSSSAAALFIHAIFSRCNAATAWAIYRWSIRSRAVPGRCFRRLRQS